MKTLRALGALGCLGMAGVMFALEQRQLALMLLICALTWGIYNLVVDSR